MAREDYLAHHWCAHLCEGEGVVSGEEHIYSHCPWSLRAQEVNKVDKRENVNIGHCEVTSIRGKVVISAQHMENAHSAGNEISTNSSYLSLIIKASRTSGCGGRRGGGETVRGKACKQSPWGRDSLNLGILIGCSIRGTWVIYERIEK